MADSKQKPEKPEFDPTVESAELEHHVDQLMDPSLPDPEPLGTSAGAPALPEIDIFEGTGSPEAPVKKTSRKKVPAAVVPAGPPALADDVVLESQDESGDAPAADAVPPEVPAEATTESAIAAGTKKPEAPTEEIIPVDPSVDEEAADPLVDEIVAQESDQLLAIQDAAAAQPLVVDRPPFRERLTTFFRNWWENKPARYGTIAVVLLALAATAAIPTSRYYVLNTAGVRVGARVTVLDQTTNLPLKNVAVTIGDVRTMTNTDGVVRMKGLELGEQQMTIRRLGFAQVSRPVTLGLGSNPLEDVGLKAVGAQYSFKLTDYLSGKPVTNGEVASGDANAQTDDKGVAILTIGKLESAGFDVVISANGFRSEKAKVSAEQEQATNVTMVNKRKEIFVSKQSGKFDVFKVDIDGKNKQLLLAGSGRERDQITVVSHQTDEVVALVSSREERRNQDGYLLDTLTLINVSTGSTTTLEHSERIQIVDWMGDRLVYVKIKAGTSAGNPERNQLMSYDYNTTNRQQLAAANNFPDIISAKGTLYYAASNNYAGGKSVFAKVNPDTTNKQTLLESGVWNIIRRDYDNLYLAGSDNWSSYRLGDSATKKLDKSPNNPSDTRFYLDAPDGKHAISTDSRDGKGVLLSYDAASRKDKILVTQGGLTHPLRWLDSRTVIYRVATPQETAAYVVSLDGGSPKKIIDVTNTSGLGHWSYGYF